MYILDNTVCVCVAFWIIIHMLCCNLTLQYAYDEIQQNTSGIKIFSVFFMSALFKLTKAVYFMCLSDITADLSSPDIEGVYETQVPLDFRALVKLGCLTTVNREFARSMEGRETDTFDINNLNFRSVAQFPYLSLGSIKHLYLYHHKWYVCFDNLKIGASIIRQSFIYLYLHIIRVLFSFILCLLVKWCTMLKRRRQGGRAAPSLLSVTTAY